MASSILAICTLGPCSMLKVITPQALSFLSSQLRIVLTYFFLAAVLDSESGITGFSSFPEVTHQRPLAFRVLVISTFHDS